MINYKQKLRHITTFIFDVDGVLTNGDLLLLDGQMLRKMNAKDGFALKRAVDRGFRVAIITGGRDENVKTRLQNLGIKDIVLNSHDKIEAYDDLQTAYGFDSKEVIYMGDDMPDIPVMREVGLPCCPNDAVSDVRAVAEYISLKNGGEGCVRDIIEQTLKVQEKWKD